MIFHSSILKIKKLPFCHSRENGNPGASHNNVKNKQKV